MASPSGCCSGPVWYVPDGHRISVAGPARRFPGCPCSVMTPDRTVTMDRRGSLPELMRDQLIGDVLTISSSVRSKAASTSARLMIPMRRPSASTAVRRLTRQLYISRVARSIDSPGVIVTAGWVIRSPAVRPSGSRGSSLECSPASASLLGPAPAWSACRSPRRRRSPCRRRLRREGPDPEPAELAPAAYLVMASLTHTFRSSSLLVRSINCSGAVHGG